MEWNPPGCYSGTVIWTTHVHGAGYEPFESTANVTATFDSGMVSCEGSYTFHQTYRDGARTESAAISGVGSFHYGHLHGDRFSVSVDCPLGQVQVHRTGSKPQPWSKDETSHTGTTTGYGVETASFEGPLPEDYRNRLSGTVTHETPYADPSNDVTASMTVTWNLTNAGHLTAVALVQHPIVRGAVAAFDGSHSTGKITGYRWTLTPRDCPHGGREAVLDGARVSARLLCAVSATLEVTDGRSTALSEPVIADVTPRRWTTLFPAAKEKRIRGPFSSEGMFFGKNVCAFGDDVSDKIHREHKGSRTWEGVGYALDQVEPGGPFGGFWYVARKNLTVARELEINERLFPGHDVYDLQRSKAEADRLLRQVRAHEAMHGTLMQRALAAAPDKDPAQEIESLYGAERDRIKTDADFKIGEADTRLSEATDEPAVRAELRRIPEFRRGGSVYRDDATSIDFPSYADIGDDYGG
jgi:hypothetical protein